MTDFEKIQKIMVRLALTDEYATASSYKLYPIAKAIFEKEEGNE